MPPDEACLGVLLSSGKIYLPYLHEWSHPNSDLLGLVSSDWSLIGKLCSDWSILGPDLCSHLQ